ncbi:hypothetical protein NDU88_000690 [Pleurodeles waltl]|uniref:Uncharacterized protein n=1 Tax=Pleurodeles waltl TaxID=8319 RepID=A0AAV7SAR8_PLEWA|nr:hypothetical protein NDU88_000690 [Pleurodeles waltl]
MMLPRWRIRPKQAHPSSGTKKQQGGVLRPSEGSPTPEARSALRVREGSTSNVSLTALLQDFSALGPSRLPHSARTQVEYPRRTSVVAGPRGHPHIQQHRRRHNAAPRGKQTGIAGGR